MIKKKVVIIAIATISSVLNGMLVLDKKIKKTKSQKSSQELTASSGENSLSPMYSGKKLPIKSLNDVKELERARSEFRDKTGLSKSESSLDKK